jgi:hypothetical protein
VPLVTTHVGAEGIPDYQKVMAVSDDPLSFAKAVAENVREANYPTSAAAFADRANWLNTHFSAQNAERAIACLIDG